MKGYTFTYLFLFVKVVFGECPDGFLTHASSCYMGFGIRATWAESSIICEAYGGYLAVMNDEQEQHFLQSYIGREIGGFKPGKFWMGATDIQTDGEWKWVNSQSFSSSTYQNWAPNQPDNRGNNEHCMTMNFVDHFKWSDSTCENYLNFVCEIPSGMPTVQTQIIG